jgi:homoaconitase/3-isopropylmalate dehydratase large subunit
MSPAMAAAAALNGAVTDVREVLQSAGSEAKR